ncbi:MAG TPA: hypothetical protein VNE18_01595 [Rhodanobacter sp.]|nr:hypothetical protein [Rhodanobacter sp.]
MDFDRAFELEPDVRLAMAVTFASFEGSEWDWAAMRFRERK